MSLQRIDAALRPLSCHVFTSMPSHGSELPMSVGMSTTCHLPNMATSLRPPCCSPGLPTDDITHLDEDIKSAAFRFTTVTEILKALIPLRLEPITALKPDLMFNISDVPKQLSQ